MTAVFGQTLDLSSANNEKTIHFSRQAEVIFLKKVKNFPDPGSVGEADLTEAQIKFSEFIKAGIMVENFSLEKRDLDPDILVGEIPRYTYWQVTTTSVSSAKKLGGTTQLLPNGDVQTINIVESTKDMNSATIVLRNPQEKYIFKNNPMYVGETLFESDDLVFINLPGADGNMYRKFTGLITTVKISTTVGDTLNSTVIIECSDMLKKLKETRTNARPSFSAVEASGSPVAFYNTSYAALLPHQILTMIFARGYCDLSSVSGLRTQLEAIREQGKSDSVGALKAEEELLQKFSTLPSGTPAGTDFSQGSGLFIVTVGKTSATVSASTQAPTNSSSGPTLTKDVRSDIPRQIFGFRQARKTTLSTNDIAVSKYSPIDVRFSVDDLAFSIEGTAQPVYSIGFGTFGLDRFISDWKSSYSVAKEITDTLEFELSTTNEGVVRVRPLNVLLPADIKNNETTPNVPAAQKPRVGSEYWLQKSMITNELYKDTDTDIFTVAYVLGKYKWDDFNVGLEYTRAGIVVDTLKFNRLGARMAPQQVRLELLDAESCRAFARAYLNRLNAKARTASISYLGDARIQSGNPCYIQHRNRIYYIDTITHNFTAGKSYTMEMSLTYGRRPIAIATTTDAFSIAATIGDKTLAANVVSRYTFNAAVRRLALNGSIDTKTLIYSNSVPEAIRYQQQGPKPPDGAGTGQLVFNGFVWEDLNVMTFEDIKTDSAISDPALDLSELMYNFRLKSRAFLDKLQAYSIANPSVAPSLVETIVLDQEAAERKAQH